MKRVLIVEDHQVFRDCLSQVLDQEPGIKIVGTAENGLEAISILKELKPDVVLMDIKMESLDGLEATRRIKKCNENIRIIILTQYELGEYLYKAYRFGASGYLLKKTALAELVDAINKTKNNDFYIGPSIGEIARKVYKNYKENNAPADELDFLSNREKEVLQLIGEGLQVKTIANKLHISPKTVAVHRSKIMAKLGIHSAIELAHYAWDTGCFEKKVM